MPVESIRPELLDRIARGMVRGLISELSPARGARLYNITAVVDSYRTVFEWKRVPFPPDAGSYVVLSVDMLNVPVGAQRLELRVELVVDPTGKPE